MNYRIAFSLLLVATFSVTACSSSYEKRQRKQQKTFSKSIKKTSNEDYKGFKTNLRSDIESHLNARRNLPGCKIRGHFTNTGVVLDTASELRIAGMQRGDRIQTIEGEPLSGENINTIIAAFNPTQTLTFEMLSGDSIQVKCRSREPIDKEYKVMLNAIDAKNWDSCKASARTLERLGGHPIPVMRHVYAKCNEYKLTTNGIGTNRETALDHFNVLKAAITHLEYDTDLEMDIESNVLGTTSWMRTVNSHDLAQQTLNNYQVALQKRAAFNTPVASAPVPKSVIPKNSQGTCFAVSTEGLIVTNHQAIDLAILKVDRTLDNFLPVAHSNESRTGSEVFTMGFPVAQLLGSEPKYTEGVVSSKTGLGGEAAYMQITVPIQPGNSGGPLVNFKGEVVGITTATAAVLPFLESTGGAIPQNVNFAVKSEYITSLAENIEYSQGLPESDRQAAIDNVRSSLCQIQASS